MLQCRPSLIVLLGHSENSIFDIRNEVLRSMQALSTRTVDLARDLIELSGLEVGRDIDIEFNGVRPGEKPHEQLFLPGERCEPTGHANAPIVRGASEADIGGLRSLLDEAQRAVRDDDDALAAQVLRRLAPVSGE